MSLHFIFLLQLNHESLFSRKMTKAYVKHWFDVNNLFGILIFDAIDLFTDSDAILKILSVDFCGKVKVNSDSSSKIV